MTKILMVCLGNICRSPLAEGILRHRAEQAGANIEVDSCGTSNWHAGESPDGRTQDNARTHGVNLSSLRARQFRVSDFDEFDLIYVMDRANFRDVEAQARTADDMTKVDLLLNQSNPGTDMAVPDPYYGGPSGFEDVYQLVDEACAVIVDRHT